VDHILYLTPPTSVSDLCQTCLKHGLSPPPVAIIGDKITGGEAEAMRAEWEAWRHLTQLAAVANNVTVTLPRAGVLSLKSRKVRDLYARMLAASNNEKVSDHYTLVGISHSHIQIRKQDDRWAVLICPGRRAIYDKWIFETEGHAILHYCSLGWS